jgi:excisionase family DNA binding protein
MITDETPPKIDHLERIQGLDPDRWGDGKFVVGEDGKWHYEGFVNLLQAVHQAMRAVDPSIPPGLPPHCLDPVVIAKFFRVPLQDMNWQGKTKPELPNVDTPYLAIKEAASYLRTTVQGIYSLVKRGKLHPMPGRRTLRFTREALDKCMTTRRRRRARVARPSPEQKDEISEDAKSLSPFPPDQRFSRGILGETAQ